MLDEALDIVTGLQSGKPFTYYGKHYHVSNALFHPVPVQSPRVPVWVAGCWPHRRPFRRAARWDGIVPIGAGVEPFPPKKIREMVDYIQKYRNGDSPFDVCLLGRTAGKDLKADRATVKSYVPAGLTWYLEAIHSRRGSIKQVRERIKIGPPH
jgi:alkanesulfonate monooxygenase SsuD/methylene tetrahydromethanopterin reductase-like flavin-dependent oxidoreductase (luciferase family)